MDGHKLKEPLSKREPPRKDSGNCRSIHIPKSEKVVLERTRRVWPDHSPMRRLAMELLRHLSGSQGETRWRPQRRCQFGPKEHGWDPMKESFRNCGFSGMG